MVISERNIEVMSSRPEILAILSQFREEFSHDTCYCTLVLVIMTDVYNKR